MKKTLFIIIVTLLLCYIVSLFHSSFVFASDTINYPIPELGYCRDERECYLYCQIPVNTPACWSYGKYILYPQVLGTTSVKLTYPIAELGKCNSATECFNYCQQSANWATCMSYGKSKGLTKSKVTIRSQVITAAKKEMGCNNQDACLSLCSEEANREKCTAFSEKYGLQPGASSPITSKVLQQAKKTLGCDSADSCKLFCSDIANQQKCVSFAQKYKLAKSEELQKYEAKRAKETQFLQYAKKELGCNTADSCRNYCTKTENMEKCSVFSGKYNTTTGTNAPTDTQPTITPNPTKTVIPTPTKKATTIKTQSVQPPVGCVTEEECEKKCAENPDQCPGFSAAEPVSSSNLSTPSAASENGK